MIKKFEIYKINFGFLLSNIFSIFIMSAKPEDPKETPEVEETIEEELPQSTESENEQTIEDLEKQQQLEKEKIEQAKKEAKEKLEKQKKLEKKKLEEQAKKEAKKEFEAEQKLQKLNEKMEMQKIALIQKIKQNANQNGLLLNSESLEKMALDQLNHLYLGMVKRTLKEYRITCTKNCGFVDFANIKEDAIKKRDEHSKVCPLKPNYGNWIILGLVLTMIAGVGVAIHSQSKKNKEDPEE